MAVFEWLPELIYRWDFWLFLIIIEAVGEPFRKLGSKCYVIIKNEVIKYVRKKENT